MGMFLFAAGSYISLLVMAAVSVYAFNVIEPMWGHGGSFQVLGMLAIPFSFVATISFGFASAATRRWATNRAAFLLGAASSALSVALLVALRSHIGPFVLFVALAAFILFAALAPFGARRAGG